MGITIGELLEIPYLRTRLYAGAKGRDNLVTWAHSCEVPNPWNWLDAGDLLMTNGYALPPEPGPQAEFVEQLHGVGISGLAIGERQHAPPIGAQTRRLADELGMPILFTAFEVPFVALTRTVADANSRPEQLRLQRTVRLYDRLREATLDRAGSDLIDRLGEDLRAQLYVLDPDRGVDVLPSRRPPTQALREAIVEVLGSATRPLPALSRVPAEGTTVLAVPVPSQRAAVLVAVPKSSRRLDLAILQHVATISALQVERETAEREQRRRFGAETFAHLLDGRLDSVAARTQLEAQGLCEGPFSIAACASRGGPSGGALHHHLNDAGIAHLLLRRGEVLLVLTTDEPRSLEAVREGLGPDVRIGLGDAFTDLGRGADAARQAHWALQAAASERVELMRYGENAPLFMPRTLGELEAAVRDVLGVLIEYDQAHDSELVESLRTFLRHNRSWQRAAQELFIHKQTLVYRMGRIEDLTGRRLDDTGSVAELWLSLRAMDLSQGNEHAGAGSAQNAAGERS